MAIPPGRPPRTVAVIGSLNWGPNLEGLRWLLAEVWPRVREALPDLTLHIAGSHPPAWLTGLRAPGVVVHGFVPSAVEFLQQHPVLLVPLLSGGGMRIKIIEAMTLGRCVLTTTVGGEGIEAAAGQEWLVADSPAEWVAALVGIFNAPSALDPVAIGQAAAALAARRYDNVAVIQAFEALYTRLGAGAETADVVAHPQPHVRS
ncbi:MAG: glycosyltransferase [Hymenobacteraceae bacterium]|nr:glycosyltransferase [Hymenobacteraceae bacterium]